MALRAFKCHVFRTGVSWHAVENHRMTVNSCNPTPQEKHEHSGTISTKQAVKLLRLKSNRKRVYLWILWKDIVNQSLVTGTQCTTATAHTWKRKEKPLSNATGLRSSSLFILRQKPTMCSDQSITLRLLGSMCTHKGMNHRD